LDASPPLAGGPINRGRESDRDFRGGLPTVCKEASGDICRPLLCVLWNEGGLAFEHGAGDGEEAVANRAERTGVTMTALSQGGIFGAASRVVLHGAPGPMIKGIG